ncbi:MAG: hypothetical protein ABSB13_03595 [Candidatus Binatus sp.]|jgi:hypothetical protein|uniref:hypothetical protein n=1 Tax=Candidatus Binatus sp. TaxID=2811406 RepID=UPI003D14E175
MAERFESAAPHPLHDEWYARITTPKPGSASPGKALKLLAAFAIALIALNLYAPGAPTILERVFASAILASLALPVWLWMSGADRTIPFMPFLTLNFTYYYALPVFLLRHYVIGLFKPPVAAHFITLALGYSLLGLYCMFAGYYGPAKWLFAPILPRFSLQWRDERVVRMVALMLGVGGLFLSSSHGLPGSLAQIGVFAADLSMVGICMLVALQLAGRLDRITSAFVWGFLLPVRIAIGLGGGSAASGLIVGITVAMMFASVRRSIPWKTLLLGTVVAVFIIRPAEVPYRAATWGGRQADAGPIEKALLYGDIVYRITIGGAVDPQTLIEFGSLRLAQFTTFGEVIADTPAFVPFWRGESYYPILFKPIPRFIMPDKPEEMSGQTFGHRYGLISARNTTTSLNLPQLVELYANFGLIGVIAGMFIFGLIYRLLIEMYVHPGMGLGALVGGVYVLSKLVDVGSAASIVFGAIPWSIIFIALIGLLIDAAELDAMTLDATVTGK